MYSSHNDASEQASEGLGRVKSATATENLHLALIETSESGAYTRQ